jgi:EpsI family protein
MHVERTITHDKPNLRPVIVAAVVASVLMLSFGLMHHALAARLAAPTGKTPIDPNVLAAFPVQIGSWAGRDVPMDEAVVRATDTDARINRLYTRDNGLKSVSFYVACGVQARDLMPHRPEVCYTGNGWTLVTRSSLELPMSDGKRLPCNVIQFSRGALNAQKVVVLDYYLVDGEYCADVSLLRSKAWRGSGAVGYVAQVQIVSPITETMAGDAATRLVSGFAVESAPLVARMFERSAQSGKR